MKVTPMHPMPDDVWLGLQQVRQLLMQGGFDRSDDTLRKMADKGLLPTKRDGTNERRYSFLGILAWLEVQRRIAAKKPGRRK